MQEKTKKIRSGKPRKIILNALRGLVLALVSVISLFPILYALLSSFKSNREFLTANNFLPKEWLVENYVHVWNELQFSQYVFNSVYIAVGAVLVTLLASSIMGYCLERGNFKGKGIIMSMYLLTMFFAGGMSLYPNFELMVNLGLNDTINGLVLLRLANQGSNAFMIMGALKTIPRELDEAAKIDGCSFFRRYWNIILPMLKPTMATITILSFLAAWNEYQMTLAFSLANPAIRTITVGVVSLQNEMATSVTPYNYMLAGATFSIVPALLVFIFMNKRIISNIAAGAVKG